MLSHLLRKAAILDSSLCSVQGYLKAANEAGLTREDAIALVRDGLSKVRPIPAEYPSSLKGNETISYQGVDCHYLKIRQ